MRITAATLRALWIGAWLCVAYVAPSVLPVADAAAAETQAAPTCFPGPGAPSPVPQPGEGIITTIITDMQNVLNTVAANMFVSIIGDSGFRTAVQAVTTLYIAIYGILFTLGMVQISLYDFVIRVVKIAIIVTLISPGSWAFFSGTVVTFFNQGTDELINAVTQIAVGAPGLVQSGQPFYALDAALAKAVSAQMGVTLMAIFGTGVYGIIIGLLLVIALGSFLKSMLNAMWVYVMALVLKTLLFGLAPIFISCILFNRTRHLFDGWLNQIINASLQPIFLFTFFAFFAQLISASLDNLLATPVCWTEWAESLRGSPFSEHFWRFTLFNENTGKYELFGGLWGFTGAQTNGNQAAPVFPIDILAVLVFFMLAELAGRFNAIVVEIAKDLAGAATNLSGMGGSIADLFTSVGSGTSAAPGSAPVATAGLGGRAGGQRMQAGGEMVAQNTNPAQAYNAANDPRNKYIGQTGQRTGPKFPGDEEGMV